MVDVLKNKVIFQKAIADYRVYAACSKGEGSQIFMIGGQDPHTGLWTRDATYIENLALEIKDQKKRPLVPKKLSEPLPMALIGPSMYHFIDPKGEVKIYVTGVDAQE